MLGSGNPFADRRFDTAQILLADGDVEAAADLFEQALTLAPEWAAAWLALGLTRERSGNRPGAIEALGRASGLDSSGMLGARLHLARLQGEPVDTMPTSFVSLLFDQYADRFDAHLVQSLGYRAPTLLAEAMARAGAEHLSTVLDLGCGTGLMGRALAGQAQAIDGVDLSPRMIQRAHASGCYRHLAVADLLAHLVTVPQASYDAAVAADVLVYIGALEDVVAAVRRVIRPGGLFAFTVQRADDVARYRLGPDMRFSHARNYVETVLAGGFQLLLLDRVATRQNRGVPVPGLLLVARRS